MPSNDAKPASPTAVAIRDAAKELRPLHADLYVLFKDLESLLHEVVTLLRKLLANACVNLGDGTCEEDRNIQVLKEYLESNGVQGIQVHNKPDRPKRTNLIAEYGSGSPRVMLGPGHVDVVPVHSDDDGKTYPGWDCHPFEGQIKDGCIWGRGTVDMLNTVAAHAVVFTHIVKAKIAMKGTLVFCAVSDEEAGGTEGVGYLMSDPTTRHVFRADYAVTEVGGAALLDRHHEPTNVVVQANSEKGVGVLEVRCKGRGGHGSIPLNADNALVRAAEVVHKLGSYWAPTVITDEWRSFVKGLDLPRVIRACMLNSWLLSVAIRLLLTMKNPLGPLAHALTRLTMTPNHVKGSLKVNVVPSDVCVEVDVRTLPGQEKDYVMAQLRRALGAGIMDDKEHYHLGFRSFTPASRSPVDTPLWTAMQHAAEALQPGCQFAHVALPGATDSRFFRLTHGTVAYGANLFEPCTDFAQLMKRFHGNNERLELSSLATSVEFFGLTVLNMLKAAQPL